MKFIIPGSVILIILISGFGASSTSIEYTMKGSHMSVSFSEPVLTSTNDTISIELPEANGITTTPNEPMVPIYKKTIIYPVKTIIKEISIRPSETIKQIGFSGSVQYAPTVGPPNMDIVETDRNTVVTSTAHLYPEKWYDYSLDRGLYNGTPSLILNIIFYPIRVVENTIYYSNDF